jgi:hypothetical protein
MLPEPAHGPTRLSAGHLLGHDGGNQIGENVADGSESQARIAPMQLGYQAVAGGEGHGVVFEAGDGAKTIEQACSTITPGLTLEDFFGSGYL